MSTTTASLTTRLRTWVFLAGLTALLIGAGALAGGAFLYAFVGLAVLMNLVGYWFSDRIALGASRAAEHVEAVLAHELAHIRDRDVRVSTIAAMIAGAISAIANILRLSFLLLDGGRPLADALETLEAGTGAAPTAVNPAFASLYVANPLPRAGLATLFSTHPPIGERVRRLRAGDAALATRLA